MKKKDKPTSFDEFSPRKKLHVRTNTVIPKFSYKSKYNKKFLKLYKTLNFICFSFGNILTETEKIIEDLEELHFILPFYIDFVRSKIVK